MGTNFYDSNYWQQGEGQELWEMRKLLAFIMKISGESTPAPFLTHLGEEAVDDYYGWIAEWSTLTKEGLPRKSLSLEYEDGVFLVFALDLDSDYKNRMEFWYEFNHKDTGDTPETLSWDRLPDAVDSAKKWLEENHDGIRHSDERLDREFNIR